MDRMRALPIFAITLLLGAPALAVEPAGQPTERVGPRSPDAAAVAVAEAASREVSPQQDAGEAEADQDAPDEAAIEQEVQAESAELEQVRAAEEKARIAESVVAEDPAARAASRLGLESPLRRRLREVFGREASPAATEAGGRIAVLPEIEVDLQQLQAKYDIPIEVNEQVRKYIRFFQTPLVRKHFVRWLGRSSKYIPVFRRVLREHGLPEDTVYLAMIESGFANHATSRAKAVGPWQFISATGKRMGLKQDFWVDERRDPEKAAHAAAKYLQELFRQTGDWKLAWAGYNAGVGKIFKAQQRGQLDFWTMTRGRVLKSETKGYVPKLMACAIIAKHPQAFGFSKEEIEPERWREYDEVVLEQATPLSAVAQAAGVEEKALLDLNPELRRTCTPPRPYALKLPQGQREAFAKNWPTVSETVGSLAFTQHRVSRGESLRAIAKHYQVDEITVARMNGLRPARHVKPGTEIVIPVNAAARTQSAAFAAAEPPPPPEKASRGKRGSRRTVARSEVAGPRRALAEVAGRLRSTVLVRAGDSLWGIAQKFGVDIEELCRWNGIRNPRRFKLQAGRALVVYRRQNEALVAPAPSIRPG